VRAELAWGRDHLLPWVWRHLRGRSSGDGRTAKLPELTLLTSHPSAIATGPARP
jgi:hypothetical protein